ncbi:hypothetical protein AB9K26_07545 [Psychroserpens sp. XS_ASV72]|uniref:hypothetical protein n=1 Tax=Psychroserpens sp. XS_ASV72 TaxID=3241293 RepID=UPI003514DC1E
MKHLLLVAVFYILHISVFYAQVGIGTTNPETSSILDITSNDKGVLVPRVNLIDVTNGTTPIATPATGLLVWNTNAGVTGGNGIGFYFFNGSQWEPIQQPQTNDHDFYEEGTSAAPDNINDDTYTFGNVAIGKNTADYPLDILSDTAPIGVQLALGGTDNANRTAYNTVLSNTGDGRHYGVSTLLNGSGSGEHAGLYAILGGTGNGKQAGMISAISNLGSGAHFGVDNLISGPGSGEHYGVRNRILNNGNNVHYGVSNLLSGTGSGRQYGIHTEITNNGNANHFGSYSILSGTGTGSHYGNWVTLEGNGSGNQIGDYNYISNSGDGTHYGEFIRIEGNGTGTHNGTEIQMSGSGSGAQLGTINVIDNSGDGLHYGSYNVLRGTGTGTHYGNWARLQSTGAGNQIGNFVNISNSGNGNHYANYADMNGSGTGGHYGSYYRFFNNNSIVQVGYYALFNNSSTNSQYGLNLQIGGDGDGEKYGTTNTVYNSGNGQHYGIYNWLTGTGTGNKFGSFNLIPNTAGGNHYGVYSNVLKPGSYAGYFLGNVSIGTNSGNRYILPASRGAANQIMQTDSVGNVSWVDDPSPSYWSRTGSVLNLLNSGDDITFTSDQTSITFPSTTATAAPMFYMFASGFSNPDRMIFSHSTGAPNYGLLYDDVDDSFQFLRNGVNVVEIDIFGTTDVLTVNGNIRVNGDIITDTTTYPDYVFESYFDGKSDINKDYSFTSLEDLEYYLRTQKHLPNVKSYKEIKDSGMSISVGDMAITNLEKIEEAYLYIVELKKENDVLKNKLEAQQNEIDEVKRLLKSIKEN